MYYLGIDVGSLFVGNALIDDERALRRADYRRHQGEPVNTVRDMLADYPLDDIVALVRTGSGGEALAPMLGDYVDPVVAGVEGVRHLHPDVRNIVQIGGGSFSLTRLAGDGG